MPKKINAGKGKPTPPKKPGPATAEKALRRAEKATVKDSAAAEDSLALLILAEHKELNRLTTEVVRVLWVTAKATIAVAAFTAVIAFLTLFSVVMFWLLNFYF